MLLNIDRTSNTRIVRFLELGNRSIIPTGYKDAPQRRSIEPQTLELLGFKAQSNIRGENLTTSFAAQIYWSRVSDTFRLLV
jgi:hypothetical protein